MKYSYIVVEGSIGSGKSALSKRLSTHFHSHLLPEAPERNPFLTDFYLNAAKYALATQLDFLSQRADAARYIIEAAQRNESVVSDFLLEKDQIFAPITLEETELTLYWDLKHRIMPQYPVPDLVIYLQASDEKVHKRLENYDASMYQLFPEGYLKQIHAEYRHFFHLYQSAPLLIANTDELDFLGKEEHFQMLLHAMQNLRGLRHYLNLSES